MSQPATVDHFELIIFILNCQICDHLQTQQIEWMRAGTESSAEVSPLDFEWLSATPWLLNECGAEWLSG